MYYTEAYWVEKGTVFVFALPITFLNDDVIYKDVRKQYLDKILYICYPRQCNHIYEGWVPCRGVHSRSDNTFLSQGMTGR